MCATKFQVGKYISAFFSSEQKYTQPNPPHPTQTMAATNANPIIFALSNPTSKAECTASFAYEHSGGRCVFASGSPFDPVVLSDTSSSPPPPPKPSKRPFKYSGRTRVPGQGNNAYVFPGIGLGVIASGATSVGDDDMYVAAKTLASMVGKARIMEGCVYPELERIREISTRIAEEVAGNGIRKGRSDMGEKEVKDFIKRIQYEPRK